MPAHILIADDDSTSRDILSLVLTRGGHVVTLADNGWVAIEKLRNELFDIAILDYHMPVLDGVKVARKALEIVETGVRPRFIGVTADPDGLESRDPDHGIFDSIVQKPINVAALLEVVRTSLRELRDASAKHRIRTLWQERGFERCPRVCFASQPTAPMRNQLDCIFDLTRPENPDLILLTDATMPQDMGELRTTGNLFTLPAVDMTGRMEDVADATFRPNDPTTWDDVAARANAFASRRMQLTKRFLNASDLTEQLLAYIYVSGRDLHPVLDSTEAYGICYPGMFPTVAVLAAADNLVQRGLLKRSTCKPVGTREETDPMPMTAPRFALSDLAVEKLTGTPCLDFPAAEAG